MSVKDQVIEFLVNWDGFQILGGIIIFVCGVFIAGALGRLVKKSLSRFKIEQPVESLLVRLTNSSSSCSQVFLPLPKWGWTSLPWSRVSA